MNKLCSECKSKGVKVIGISVDTDGTGVLKEFKVNYSIVMGDEKVAQDFGGIAGLPTTYISDLKGLSGESTY